MNLQGKDWAELEQRFNEPRTAEMHKIVQYIIGSGYSKRLYAYTSLDTLIVSIYQDVHSQTEALHISFDAPTGKWNFTYHSKPFVKPTFERQYPADKGLEKFAQFIVWVRW